MKRVRYTTLEDGRRAAQIDELPSGRLQFRPTSEGAAHMDGEMGRMPAAERFEPDMEAYVEAALRAATEPGEAAGALDFEALEEEFEATGRLSEESYALLESAGIPRWIVQRYIAGQMAAGEKLMTELHDIAGGEKRFQAAHAWAGAALPQEQRQAYAEALTAGPEQAKFAVQGVCAAYERAMGGAPRLTRGEAMAGGEGAFASAAEVAEAIRDPRYKKDPAYRAKIAARLARSKVF